MCRRNVQVRGCGDEGRCPYMYHVLRCGLRCQRPVEHRSHSPSIGTFAGTVLDQRCADGKSGRRFEGLKYLQSTCRSW